jgi:hypothetical protein
VSNRCSTSRDCTESPTGPSYHRKAMEVNQADPESIGAGPLNVPPSRFSTPRCHKDRQCFQWSRVILSHDSIVPPPRSGAASVVVQGKLYMFGVSYFTFIIAFSLLRIYTHGLWNDSLFFRATEAVLDVWTTFTPLISGLRCGKK